MPGEVRCPTCGRQTPVAPYCTHCGGELPDVAGRPRGLDRHDLEERIRLRRSGDNPFHRGSPDWEQAAATGGGAAFVPEPSDELARREPAAGEPAVGHVDHLDEEDAAGTWGAESAEADEETGAYAVPPAPAPVRGAPPAAVPPAAVPPAAVPPAAVPPAYAPPDVEPEPRTPPPAAGREVDPYAPYDEGYGYGDGSGYDSGYPHGYGDEPPRRTGPIVVLGFVVLGIAALLGGAILFSLMNAGPGTASASGTPSPSAAATEQVSPGQTPGGSSGASASPSSSSGESAGPSSTEGPGVPADFSAQTQPCATSDMGFKGCTEDGSTITGDKVWIWVGFKNGRASDVIGVEILDASGNSAGDGSLELSKLNGCDLGKPCTGYITMNFSRLSSGTYDIKITLNDTDVASGSFTVS